VWSGITHAARPTAIDALRGPEGIARPIRATVMDAPSSSGRKVNMIECNGDHGDGDSRSGATTCLTGLRRPTLGPSEQSQLPPPRPRLHRAPLPCGEPWWLRGLGRCHQRNQRSPGCPLEVLRHQRLPHRAERHALHCRWLLMEADPANLSGTDRLPAAHRLGLRCGCLASDS